jgi:hypothetical protein
MTEGRQPFTAEIKLLAKGPSTYDPLENNIDLSGHSRSVLRIGGLHQIVDVGGTRQLCQERPFLNARLRLRMDGRRRQGASPAGAGHPVPSVDAVSGCRQPLPSLKEHARGSARASW